MRADSERSLLAKKLTGRKLVIPDMRPMFAHWPSGKHEDYPMMKEAVEKSFAVLPSSEKARKIVNEADPALLTAWWWPSISSERYRVMTDLVIWFGLWDDMIEKLTPDPLAAEALRALTKASVRQSLGFGEGEHRVSTTDPLISSFTAIADEVCAVYDDEQRRILLGHLEQYIDATRLEAEANQSADIPSLERYWEVRLLTVGIGTLLGFSEFALQVKLPHGFVNSAAYEALWATTIIINSIVNDLLSFKKEMRAGSILSSVAILFREFGDLDIAVKMLLDQIRRLVDVYDRTADNVLSSYAPGSQDYDSVSKVIGLMRTVNTGNLEWSLQAKRYGVADHMTEAGQIEVVL